MKIYQVHQESNYEWYAGDTDGYFSTKKKAKAFITAKLAHDKIRYPNSKTEDLLISEFELDQEFQIPPETSYEKNKKLIETKYQELSTAG